MDHVRHALHTKQGSLSPYYFILPSTASFVCTILPHHCSGFTSPNYLYYTILTHLNGFNEIRTFDVVKLEQPEPIKTKL